jgi:hypothetical protein
MATVDIAAMEVMATVGIAVMEVMAMAGTADIIALILPLAIIVRMVIIGDMEATVTADTEGTGVMAIVAIMAGAVIIKIHLAR